MAKASEMDWSGVDRATARHAAFLIAAGAESVFDEDVRVGDDIEWGFCREWARVIAIEPREPKPGLESLFTAVTTKGRVTLDRDGGTSWVVRPLSSFAAALSDKNSALGAAVRAVKS